MSPKILSETPAQLFGFRQWDDETSTLLSCEKT